MKRAWKRIMALMLAVVVIVSSVPVGRIDSYAADPVTTMAGEELAAWVFTAIAAACGIQIENNCTDLATEYERYLRMNNGLTETDYQLLYYAAGVEGVKVVGREAFNKAEELWDSLVDGTYAVINGGIAVTSDMIETVSAFFSDRTQAYTPSFTGSCTLGSGLFVGGRMYLEYSTSLNTDKAMCDIYGSGVGCVAFQFLNSNRVLKKGYMIFDYSGTGGTYWSISRSPGSPDFADLSKYYVSTISPNTHSTLGFFDGSEGFGGVFAQRYGIMDITYLGPIVMNDLFLNGPFREIVHGNAYPVSLVENGILASDVAMPWDNWDTTKDEAGEDVIILNPGGYGSPDDLGKDMGDAITAGILAGLLSGLGLKEKNQGGDIPTPTSGAGEGGTDVPSSGTGEGEGTGDVSLSDILAGIKAIPGSIADAITGALSGVTAIPGQIANFFTIDTAAVNTAYGSLTGTFQGRFSGLTQLGAIFNQQRSFDDTPPVFTMQTPDCLKFAIKEDTMVILDLRKHEDIFKWIRVLLNASIWYLFAWWVLNQFDVKFHIG